MRKGDPSESSVLVAAAMLGEDVDGAQAVTFLVRVKERLEDPIRMLLEV